MHRVTPWVVLAASLLAATSSAALAQSQPVNIQLGKQFAQAMPTSTPTSMPAASPTAAVPPLTPPVVGCTAPADPYKNYACLDEYLERDAFGLNRDGLPDAGGI